MKTPTRLPLNPRVPAGAPTLPLRLQRLILLMLFALPLSLHAQFNYVITNGAVTITEYTNSAVGPAVIPDSIEGAPVIAIGSYVIGNRTNVTSIAIPNSVTNIDQWAFWNGPSVLTITVDPDNVFYTSVDGILFDKRQTVLLRCPAGRSGNYQIPDGVVTIAQGAFMYCRHLTSVTIPPGVYTIPDYSFDYCRSLTNITIPDGVTSIGVEAFSQCGFASVAIPHGVTNIADWGFAGCYFLTSITIPDSVTDLGYAALSWCTNLTNVVVGNRLTTIGGYAFYFDTSLTNITIPDSVTGIDYAAFCNCYHLRSVVVGSGVGSIVAGDYGPFRNCYELTGIYFSGNAPQLFGEEERSLFAESTNVVVYYLPGTTGWGPMFGGRPTAPWLPAIESTDPGFGFHSGQFGFNIQWATSKKVVVEASTNLHNPTWLPLGTNTIIDGTSLFRDVESTNYTARFYRIRSL